jgi:soluble lytic murein transglycosylase-like protein
MSFKNLCGAIALSAAFCLPLGLAASSSALANRAEQVIVNTVTNFNQGARQSARKQVSSRKATARKSRKSVHKSSRKVRGGNASMRSKVTAHARAAGVPVSTALAVVKQESGLRAHVTGSAGEIGLMQIKCQTARGIGFKGSCKALYDADTNLRYGMKYLRMALNRGSVGYYNAGIHAKRLPKAARKYARQVASRS